MNHALQFAVLQAPAVSVDNVKAGDEDDDDDEDDYEDYDEDEKRVTCKDAATFCLGLRGTDFQDSKMAGSPAFIASTLNRMDWVAQSYVAVFIFFCDLSDLVALPDLVLDLLLLVVSIAAVFFFGYHLQPLQVAQQVGRLLHREYILGRIGDVTLASDEKMRGWGEELRFLSKFQATYVLRRVLEGDEPILSDKQIRTMLLHNKQIACFYDIDFEALLEQGGDGDAFELPGTAGVIGALAVATVLKHYAKEAHIKELVCSQTDVGVAGARALGMALSASKLVTVHCVIVHKARILVQEFLSPDTCDAVDQRPELEDDPDADDENDDDGDMASYQAVDLSRKRLVDADVSLLSQLLIERSGSGHGALDLLDLGENEITDAGIDELVRSGALHCVRSLSFKHNMLGTAASRRIGEELLNSESTEVRCLTTDHWAVHEGSRSLRAVDEGLMDDDVLVIAGLLKHNVRVRELNLSFNEKMTRRGQLALTQMISNNRSLRVLKLNSCDIVLDPKFIKALFEQNETLRVVQLAKNRIDDPDANAIGIALRANTTLKSLTVYRHAINVQEAKRGQLKALGKLHGINALIVLQLRRKIFVGGPPCRTF
eukprot:g4310.t1